MLILSSFFKEKPKAGCLEKASSKWSELPKLTTLHVCSNKPMCSQNTSSELLSSFHLIHLLSAQLGTDSSRQSDSRYPSDISQCLITWKKITDKCENIIKKASPSVSRNITIADLCSVKVLMEDITIGCFLILLCLIAHTFGKKKSIISMLELLCNNMCIMLERKSWRLKTHSLLFTEKAFSSQK